MYQPFSNFLFFLFILYLLSMIFITFNIVIQHFKLTLTSIHIYLYQFSLNIVYFFKNVNSYTNGRIFSCNFDIANFNAIYSSLLYSLNNPFNCLYPTSHLLNCNSIWLFEYSFLYILLALIQFWKHLITCSPSGVILSSFPLLLIYLNSSLKF